MRRVFRPVCEEQGRAGRRCGGMRRVLRRIRVEQRYGGFRYGGVRRVLRSGGKGKVIIRWLVEDFKFIVFFYKPFDGFWEGFFDSSDGFEGVVEYDDGAVAGVSFYVIVYAFCRHVRAVVAGYDIQHDDAEEFAEPYDLRNAHVAVRRTEQGAVDVFGGFGRITDVFFRPEAYALHMVVCMIADAMAAFR